MRSVSVGVWWGQRQWREMDRWGVQRIEGMHEADDFRFGRLSVTSISRRREMQRGRGYCLLLSISAFAGFRLDIFSLSPASLITRLCIQVFVYLAVRFSELLFMGTGIIIHLSA